MSKQANVPVEMVQGRFEDFHKGESVYVSPDEVVTTADRKHYLSTAHLASGYATDYHCARVDIEEAGVKIDMTACEEYKKNNALKPLSDTKPPADTLPVLELTVDRPWWR